MKRVTPRVFEAKEKLEGASGFNSHKNYLNLGCTVFVSFLLLTPIFIIGANTAFALSTGDYDYQLINNGTAIEITHYNGGGYPVIPDAIEGRPVTSIGPYAFSNCTDFTSINIPGNVTTIGNYAFNDCERLASVNISNGVMTIGEGAFYDCYSLTSVTIPKSVTTIGDSAFSWCNHMTSVAILGNVKSVGNYTFMACASLASMTIPDSAIYIGDSAFCSTALTNVTIPRNVISIGDGGFAGCSSLTSIEVNASNVNYASFDGALYDFYDGNTGFTTPTWYGVSTETAIRPMSTPITEIMVLIVIATIAVLLVAYFLLRKPNEKK